MSIPNSEKLDRSSTGSTAKTAPSGSAKNASVCTSVVASANVNGIGASPASPALSANSTKAAAIAGSDFITSATFATSAEEIPRFEAISFFASCVKDLSV